MNLLSGVVLKLSERDAPAIYHALYLGLGLCFALAMAYLLRALAIGRWLTLGLVTLFFCSPAFIYFENLLLYEFPTAVLLTVSAVLLHRALVTGRGAYWFLFFLDCAAIAYTRLTFHLVWVLAMVVLAVLFARHQYKQILLAALLPVLLVVALYAKNQVLFGFFGASSRTGFALALMTTRALPRAERNQWVRAGKLHAVSRFSPFSGAAKYAHAVDLTAVTGIPVLDRISKADGTPNYNHKALIEVGRMLLRDDRSYIAARPWDYLRLVLHGRYEYLSPTTRWHPKDPGGSPHREVRAILGRYEDLYNTALHAAPRPYGLYTLIVPLVAWSALVALRALFLCRFAGREREKLVLFMVLQSAYVPAVSLLATHGELARYRFLVEAFMWIAACWGVCWISARLPVALSTNAQKRAALSSARSAREAWPAPAL